MKIFIEREKKKIELKIKNCTVSELIKKLGLRTNEVLVTRNNILITEDSQLKDTDEIKIMSVISGG